MIISASRRTDIPAFYAKWFMNRIRAGYCAVPNPFNRKQISHISLKPEDVDVIVFWTRNPRPMFPYLKELENHGYRYYFLYTVLANPRTLDPSSPRLRTSFRNFHELADQIGPERVVWRYDPIVFTRMRDNMPWHQDLIMSSLITDVEFHCQTYKHIARNLRGHTSRSVISIMHKYSKASKRFKELGEQGIEIISHEDLPKGEFGHLMRDLAETADENGMEIASCAEETDLRQYNIRPGKCVDDAYIREVFGDIEVTKRKDPGQRKACGCVKSRDIGMYDSCLFGCKYCYATRNFENARINHARHNPLSPSLIGWHDAPPKNQKKGVQK